MLTELIPEQKKLGNNVTVLIYKSVGSEYESQIQELGCQIINLNKKNIRTPKLIPKIREIISKYDIVHVHLFPALYQVAIANIGLKNVLVYTEHSNHDRRRDIKLLRPIEKWIFSKYHAIIAISKSTKTSLIEWIGRNQKNDQRVHVIYNGINLDSINKANPTEYFQNTISKYILMVSRFVPSKDQETLIRAIPHIRDKRLKIVFAGDGSTLLNNKLIADSLGVAERCVFLGQRNDVPSLIKGCTLGVQSSHWEGFGLTAVEFMAAGKPIIASNIPGISEVVDGAGDLFTHGNEIDLASKINSLLDNTNLYDQRSKACKGRALKYNIKNMSQKYQELYINLIEKNNE